MPCFCLFEFDVSNFLLFKALHIKPLIKVSIQQMTRTQFQTSNCLSSIYALALVPY